MAHIRGISPSLTHPREKDEFYATDGFVAIPALLKLLKWNSPKKIWDNCCGMGHLSVPLMFAGHNVVATDLVNRGFGVGGVDFLAETSLHLVCDFDAIVMNPPFKLQLKFILLALKRIRQGGIVAVFLPTRYLEGDTRFTKLFDKYPPIMVAQFIKRVKCCKNADFTIKTGATAYAWFIWEKGFKGDPVVKWI